MAFAFTVALADNHPVKKVETVISASPSIVNMEVLSEKQLTADFKFVKVGVASNNVLLESNVFLPDLYYEAKPSGGYTEYELYNTGSTYTYRATGYCALSSTGTMRYYCGGSV